MSEQHSPWIINTTDQAFMEDVIERSKQVPVVLDFWATWCQPCRMLGPVLEELAVEYDGRFVLVKADGDHCPVATSQFNVQAYPTVFGLRDGEAVDYFEGVLPPEQIRAWIDRLLPSEADLLLAEARQLATEDASAAEAKFRAAIELLPGEPGPQVALAEFLLAQDRLSEAEQILRPLYDAGYEEGDVGRLLSAVTVKLAGEHTGGVAACRTACEKDPANLELKLKLAEALAAESQYEEALQTALAVVQADKANHGEPARDVMVGIFNLLPDDSDLTRDYRRKLSTALY